VATDENSISCYSKIRNSQEIIAKLRDNEAALRARRQSCGGVRLSRARGDNRPDSDIDIMIEFDPAAHVTVLATPV
jgi:uncharacterized protein